METFAAWFPPILHSFYRRARKSGLWDKILKHMVEKTRKNAGRNAQYSQHCIRIVNISRMYNRTLSKPKINRFFLWKNDEKCLIRGFERDLLRERFRWFNLFGTLKGRSPKASAFDTNSRCHI
jgi:hypothetical protein